MSNQDIFTDFPIIRLGGGLVLRKPLSSPEDPFFHFECSNDPQITPFLPDSCIPKTVNDAKMDLEYFLDLFYKKEGFFWIIADISTNEYVGNIGFVDWDKINNGAEIAYEVKTQYWSKGVATAAIAAVVKFAFLNMGVARIQATTLTHNERSMKVLQKNSFRFEGVLHQYKYHKGEFVDVAMFGYSKKQFINDNTRGQIFSNPVSRRAKLYEVA